MRIITDYLIKRPMLVCGILCVAASVIGFLCSAALPFFAVAAVALLLTATVLSGNKTLIVALAMLCAVIISLSFSVKAAKQAAKLANNITECEFCVCNVEYKNENYSVITAQISKSDLLKKGTKVTVSGFFKTVNLGDRMTASLYIKQPSSEYKADSYSKGIYISAEPLSTPKLTGNSDFVLKTIGKIRNYILTVLFSNLSPESAATLAALLMGNKDYLPAAFYDCLTKAGVNHIMVVSGLHLSITVSAVAVITDKFIYNRYKKAILQAAVVIIMTAVCGFTMSLLRAGLVYILSSLALIIGRIANPENTLGAAVSILTLFAPFCAMSLSFQLSVLATFGILCIALPIINLLKISGKPSNPILGFIIGTATVTLSATFMCAPVLIYRFGRISLVSVLANLLISPAVTLTIWLAVLAIAMSFSHLKLCTFLWKLCDYSIFYINSVIKRLGSLKYASLNVNKGWCIPAALLIPAVLWILLSCKKKKDMLKSEMSENL